MSREEFDVEVGDRVTFRHWSEQPEGPPPMGTVLKPPADAILKASINSLIQWDGIKEPQWERTSLLRVVERKTKNKLRKSADSKRFQTSGTIRILG